jgi:hypothetical protein
MEKGKSINRKKLVIDFLNQDYVEITAGEVLFSEPGITFPFERGRKKPIGDAIMTLNIKFK